MHVRLLSTFHLHFYQLFRFCTSKVLCTVPFHSLFKFLYQHSSRIGNPIQKEDTTTTNTTTIIIITTPRARETRQLNCNKGSNQSTASLNNT